MGSPMESVTATIPFQWSGHVLVTRRTQLKEAISRDEAKRPGVYLLIGDKDGENSLYIGETDELKTRLDVPELVIIARALDVPAEHFFEAFIKTVPLGEKI